MKTGLFLLNFQNKEDLRCKIFLSFLPKISNLTNTTTNNAMMRYLNKSVYTHYLITITHPKSSMTFAIIKKNTHGDLLISKIHSKIFSHYQRKSSLTHLSTLNTKFAKKKK